MTVSGVAFALRDGINAATISQRDGISGSGYRTPRADPGWRTRKMERTFGGTTYNTLFPS